MLVLCSVTMWREKNKLFCFLFVMLSSMVFAVIYQKFMDKKMLFSPKISPSTSYTNSLVSVEKYIGPPKADLNVLNSTGKQPILPLD